MNPSLQYTSLDTASLGVQCDKVHSNVDQYFNTCVTNTVLGAYNVPGRVTLYMDQCTIYTRPVYTRYVPLRCWCHQLVSGCRQFCLHCRITWVKICALFSKHLGEKKLLFES